MRVNCHGVRWCHFLFTLIQKNHLHGNREYYFSQILGQMQLTYISTFTNNICVIKKKNMMLYSNLSLKKQKKKLLTFVVIINKLITFNFQLWLCWIRFPQNMHNELWFSKWHKPHPLNNVETNFPTLCKTIYNHVLGFPLCSSKYKRVQAR